MNSKRNYFTYETKEGKCYGDFNIYQARNGKIYLLIRNRAVPLTKQQIGDLCLDVFSLIGFNYDEYIKAYAKERR